MIVAFHVMVRDGQRKLDFKCLSESSIHGFRSSTHNYVPPTLTKQQDFSGNAGPGQCAKEHQQDVPDPLQRIICKESFAINHLQ